MASFRRGLLSISTPIHEVKRFRGKINIQRPQKLFFERQLVVDVCEPIFKTKLPLIQKCTNVNPPNYPNIEEIHNPYEEIIARECANWFNHSKMVAFFHVNAASYHDRFPVFKALKKQNMHIMNYGKKVVEKALNGTPFEAVKAMFKTHTDVIFSEEIKVKEMLKIMKKLPQLVLIGGILDGKFVSRNEFIQYGNLPSLDVARAQLCHTLQMAGSNIVNQMNQHQTQLVQHLDQYVDINKNPTDDSKSNENVS